MHHPKRMLRRLSATLCAMAMLAGGATTASAVEPAPTPTATDIVTDTTTPTPADGATLTPTPAPQDAARNDASSVAPDSVRLHDEFTGQGGAVSKLQILDVTSGTAPFDNDNERGNDKDADNDIIRSYDKAVYDIDYTLTPDANASGQVMDYYKKARIGFQFLIPKDYPKDKTSNQYLSFDTESMKWVDTDDAHKSKVETVVIDGKEYLSMTAYRTVEDDEYIIPGNGTVALRVNVNGAPNGYSFSPIVRSWLDGDPERSRQIETTAKKLTVSAKMNLNINIGGLSLTGGGNYDLSTGNEHAPNKENKTLRGRYGIVRLSVTARWADRSKGLRGLEMPDGDVTYQLKLKATAKDSDTGELLPAAAWYQPRIWNSDGYWGRVPQVSSDQKLTAANSDDASIGNNGVNRIRRSEKEVNENVAADGTTVTMRFSGYDTTNFPKFTSNMSKDAIITGAGGKTCSPVYMSNDCTEYQVAELHNLHLGVVIPTYNDAGKSLNDVYGRDGITLTFSAEDANLQATSVTGDKLPTVSDNSNQSVTKDDRWADSAASRVPGDWIQRVKYSCGSETTRTGVNVPDACEAQYDDYWSPNGVDGNWDGGKNKDNGSDQQQTGKNVDFTIGMGYKLGDDFGTWPAITTSLVKYDPTVFEPRTPKDEVTETKVGYWHWGTGETKPLFANGKEIYKYPMQWYWATKKDGTGWSSVDESKKASYADLNFYNTYAEAEKHGVVLGAAYVINQTHANKSLLNVSAVQTSILKMKVKDNAKEGAIGVLTGDTNSWTRADLAEKFGIKTDAEDAKWAAATTPFDMRKVMDELVGKVTPSRHMDGNNYQESTYTPDGQYNGGDTAGDYHGDTLRVRGETVTVSKSVAQTANNAPKYVFDIDRSERYADWVLTPVVKSGKNGTTTVTLTDTLPKGLTYVPGSSFRDGTYKEHTPNAGTVEGGVPAEPDSITPNANGTTTLVWTLHDVEFNKSTPLHFTTTIGDQFDDSNDVKNGEQLQNEVTAQSTGDKSTPFKGQPNYDNAAISISKLREAALGTRSNPLLVERNQKFEYVSRYKNTGANTLSNPVALHILPSTETGSHFNGSYKLDSIKLDLNGGALPQGTRVFLTNKAEAKALSPEEVTADLVSAWTTATVDANGNVTIPDNLKSDATAYAVILPKLAPDAVLNSTIGILPSGNTSNDTYIATWMDNRNKVDAITAVVSRAVSGRVWFDTDKDGIRTADAPAVQAGVAVVPMDSTTPINTMDGTPAAITTDRNGQFTIDGLPAGQYRLYVTPVTSGKWNTLDTTVKEAQGSTDPTDSNAEPVRDGGKLKGAFVSMSPMPELAAMTSSRHILPDRDTGLTGSLAAQPLVLQSRKILNGRAFNTGETFTADITPVDGAPAGALPTSVTYKDGQAVSTSIDLTAFPKAGVYTYEMRERAGNTAGMSYDTAVRTITITVADDYSTLERTGTFTITGQPDSTSVIRWTNTYTAKPVSVTVRANKTLDDPQHTGIRMRDDMFRFRLVSTDAASQGQTQEMPVHADGTVTFQPLTYTKAGVYHYNLSEVQGGMSGVSYDKKVIAVTVTVSDDHNGQLQAHVEYDGKPDTPVFTNTYTAKPASDTVEGEKDVAERAGLYYTMQGGEFSFTATQQTMPQGAQPNATQTVTSDDSGFFQFAPFTFTLPGEYRFTITENNTAVSGISYDNTVYTIVYTVADRDHDGQLEVTGKTVTDTSGDDTRDGIEFINRYAADAVTYAPSGFKNIENTDNATSRTPRDGEFQFTITPVSGRTEHHLEGTEGTIPADRLPMPEQTSVTNKANAYTFTPITYTVPGEYRYEIKEERGTDPTISYDTTVHQLTVTVTDIGGKLTATPSLDANQLSFTNVYTPTPVQVTPQAGKHLTGRAMAEGVFQAELADANGDTVQTVAVTGVTNGKERDNGMVRESDGLFTFTPLTFTKTGEYDYRITEQQGDKPYIQYDSTVFGMHVSVTENPETRQLQTEVTYTDGKGQPVETADGQPVFTNTYTPTVAAATVEARKTLRGRGLKAGEFTFELVKDGQVVATAANGEDGAIRFEPLPYALTEDGDPVGVHEYVLREKTGDDRHVTYDTTEHKVVVTVSDDRQGALHASVTYDGAAEPCTFTNTYTPDALPPAPLADTGSPTTLMMAAALLAVFAALVCVSVSNGLRRSPKGRHIA